MHHQDYPQEWGPDELKVARKALAERIARWTVKKGKLATAITRLRNPLPSRRPVLSWNFPAVPHHLPHWPKSQGRVSHGKPERSAQKRLGAPPSISTDTSWTASLYVHVGV